MGDAERRAGLEKQLKAAMAREDAPEWLEARVMNAVKQSGAEDSRQGMDLLDGWRQGMALPHGSRGRWLGMALPHGRWRWVTAGVAAVVLIGAGNEWAHYAALERIKEAHMEAEERDAGEAAKAKLLLAMKITSTKLAEIQEKIDEAQRND